MFVYLYVSVQVFAVVVASPPGGSAATAAVSYTCGFFHIPVICTHSRDSAFSNKVRVAHSSYTYLFVMA